MVRPTKMLRQSQKLLADVELLKALQSEIKHERSSPPSQGNRNVALGDFVLDWDSSQSQDIFLRRNCESGEEVAVSALPGPFRGKVLMKVCVKKPSLSSILQFDCGVYARRLGGSIFNIHNASYLQSAACPKPSTYRGPLFSTLDPHLQNALKEYLIAKGINESLTNFLLRHLTNKEQDQYVNWLQKLESMVMGVHDY